MTRIPMNKLTMTLVFLITLFLYGQSLSQPITSINPLFQFPHYADDKFGKSNHVGTGYIDTKGASVFQRVYNGVTWTIVLGRNKSAYITYFPGWSLSAGTVHGVTIRDGNTNTIYVGFLGNRTDRPSNSRTTVEYHEMGHVDIIIRGGSHNTEAAADAIGYQKELSGLMPWDGYQHQYQLADPTFIQLSSKQNISQSKRGDLPLSVELRTKITVPYDDSLVRADVPIFGIAGGDKFEFYRIEYGKGMDPEEWELIEESNEPELSGITLADIDDSAGIAIRGNLATWDTGLKNYVYLPTHPEGHPTDLKGAYTIRLTVTGTDGSVTEDRVSVFVANVIPNVTGGVAISADRGIELLVPEHALKDHFRLIGFENSASAPSVPSGNTLAGSVYEVREAGESFLEPAKLRLKTDKKPSEKMAIFGFNQENDAWEYLPTTRRSGESALFAKVNKLHAYYAVMLSGKRKERSVLDTIAKEEPLAARLLSSGGDTLIAEDFEKTIGYARKRHGDAGAELSLSLREDIAKNNALKLTNREAGGTFAATMMGEPFDAAEFPILEFDYRIGENVVTNIYLKVSGRWYAIDFTDDLGNLAYQRLNVASIGKFENIYTDDRWRHAKFNLLEGLQTKTGNTIIEGIVFDDWDTSGFMKLTHGTNAKGATFWIDNFTIRKDAEADHQFITDIALIEDFERGKNENRLGAKAFSFSANGGGAWHQRERSDRNTALKLSYKLGEHHQFAGVATTFPASDLRGHSALVFDIKGASGFENAHIGLKDINGSETKVPLGRFIESRRDDWSRVSIPLSLFDSALDLSQVESFSVAYEGSVSSNGVVFIDNIRAEKSLTSIVVDQFDGDAGENLLGGSFLTAVKGKAEIEGERRTDGDDGFYRVSYGGDIGAIDREASDPFSYAVFRSELPALNCSKCEVLHLRVRRDIDGAYPNIYLDDGNHRWGVDLEDFLETGSSWREASIPLEEFSQYGVDLTHLVGVEIVFEWEPMEGDLSIDGIWFGPSKHREGDLTKVAATETIQ